MNIINLNRDLDFGYEGSAVDFKVGTRPLQVDAGRIGTLPVDTHKAVVRANADGEEARTIGVVGDKYKLLRNRDFFGGVEQALNKTLERDKTEGFRVKTSTSFDGAYSERRYVFPAFGGDITSNTGWKTSVGFQVISWNSYDGSSAAGMACGLIDFFCKNGCVSGENVDMTKRRHTSGLIMDDFLPLLEANIITMQDRIRMFNDMAVTKLDVERAELMLEKTFSERRAAAMVEQLHEEIETRGDNVFALHSALTFYSSHDSERFGVRKTGNDNTAKTLANRRAEVAKVVSSAPFLELMKAA